MIFNTPTLKPFRGLEKGYVECWRPIPVFTKSKKEQGIWYNWHNNFHDAFYANQSLDTFHDAIFSDQGRIDKEWHDYQQAWQDIAVLIKSFSKEGDVICDPCAGSFSTAIACIETNRRFVGCDIVEQNVINGQARIAEWFNQKEEKEQEEQELKGAGRERIGLLWTRRRNSPATSLGCFSRSTSDQLSTNQLIASSHIFGGFTP